MLGIEINLAQEHTELIQRHFTVHERIADSWQILNVRVKGNDQIGVLTIASLGMRNQFWARWKNCPAIMKPNGKYFYMTQCDDDTIPVESTGIVSPDYEWKDGTFL